MRYAGRLTEASIDLAIGSIGDSYDNALAKSVIALLRKETANLLSLWKTVGWVEWEVLKRIQ